MIDASFDRSSLGLAALDVSTDGAFGVGYWFPEDGVTEPEFEERTTFADDSPHDAGSQATQSVRGIGSLGLIVYVRGTDGTDLKTKKRDIEACVRQFSYTVALTITGTADTYTCLPGKVSWGTVDSGMTSANIARCAITIPVQPLGA